MAGNRLYVYNGRVITEARVLQGGAVVLEDGAVREVLPESRAPLPGEEAVDAGGAYISPGFVDVHVHGGGGYDFMCGDAQQVRDACALHLGHGTTTLAATVSTADNASFVRAMDAINEAARSMRDGPCIAGLHLEGPYFAMAQRGAQSPRFVRNPDPAEYLAIADRYDNILRWSAAPELPGALDMGTQMTRRGIRMSIAHSDALFEEAVRAYECGYRCVTHLYSCTSLVKRINAYRYAGIVEAAFLLDGMTVEIIADGKHLPPSLLRLVYKIKGPERICLVTDATSAAGLDGMEGEIYSQTCDSMIVIEDGVAKMPDRQSFAGSIATTDRLVRTMVTQADVPVLEAVRMMTATPARLIGLEGKKGTLRPGADADVLLFDDDIAIRAVIVGGRIVR